MTAVGRTTFTTKFIRKTSWKRAVQVPGERETQRKGATDIVFVCVLILGLQVFELAVFVYGAMLCLYGGGCLCIVPNKNDFFLSKY